MASLLKTGQAGRGWEEVWTKVETVIDYGSVAASWDLAVWQKDHRISFLGEVGFWGAVPYGRN